MRRLIVCLLLLLWPALTLAQDSPRVDVTLDTTEVIAGQPVVLRIKVLVPTWMPTPPVYPNLEQPDLMVRLPERATTPVSEKVNGETWSGTSRAYRLYPLAPGQFNISGKTLTITYAAPGSSDPVTDNLSLAPILITAIVPDAAKDLSPFIAAVGFTVDQTFEGDSEGELQVGDAITRTLTARIDGTTPILIPNLLSRPEDGPLRAYADEPRVSETENRGTLSGTRTERVSYVAQTGGTTSLPEITLNWYNLDSKTVETITLPGTELTVAEPPAPPMDPWDVAGWALAVLLAALLGYFLWRWLAPQLRNWRASKKAAWEASEDYAAQRVQMAVAAKDLNTTYAALDHWRSFCEQADALPEAAALTSALQHIGAARFGGQTQGPENWNDVSKAFGVLRATVKTRNALPDRLPLLNPLGST
ncbi:BatD family protein [Falsiphaeobacter marinintestinus]|uniref:BatD family protein n=1 Tax=Falsiphaeobacter marinintestinus TaxID=1492905 RepID=UPI0011B57A59|nr:BatD family protein [Phaeobacter marinintestinus]